ncbi:MAG: hypothetical protein ACOZAA_04560 [Pseudomonadota bacterium]
MGAEDIPDSRERAALVSLLYNTTSGTVAAIENFAPTTIGLIEDNPSDPEQIYLQRAGIWYEIVYGTNALRANDTLEAGIQNRREAEGDLFGLYTEDGANGERTPSASGGYLESKTIIRFLDEKNQNSALVTYYTDRHIAEAEAKVLINNQYDAARAQLISSFYSPDPTAATDEVAVTVDIKNHGGSVTLEDFGEDVSAQKNLVFGEELDDLILGGEGLDVIVGGDGDDLLDNIHAPTFDYSALDQTAHLYKIANIGVCEFLTNARILLAKTAQA